MQRIGVGELEDLVLGHHPVATRPEPVVVDLDGAVDSRVVRTLRAADVLPPLVGVRDGALDRSHEPLVEQFAFTIATAGPGSTWVDACADEVLADLDSTAGTHPFAAATLDRVLRVTGRVDVSAGLELESAAYSMLLGSAEFGRWRASTPARPGEQRGSLVGVARHDATVTVTLDRPQRHNALCHALRDELVDALGLAVVDPTITRVDLRGSGPSFCSGGDLDEFGSTPDPARAHLIRQEQSIGALVHRLRDIVRPHLHGACIGAGIEVPAFAGIVRAADGAWFRLPEVTMGLIPGAGGTVSIPRRIGRWRTAFLGLTGRSVDLRTALDWGLVDERE